jgi:hypothetical protein
MIGGYGSSQGCLLPACFHQLVLLLQVLPQFQLVEQEQVLLQLVKELLSEQVLG